MTLSGSSNDKVTAVSNYILCTKHRAEFSVSSNSMFSRQPRKLLQCGKKFNSINMAPSSDMAAFRDRLKSAKNVLVMTGTCSYRNITSYL